MKKAEEGKSENLKEKTSTHKNSKNIKIGLKEEIDKKSEKNMQRAVYNN